MEKQVIPEQSEWFMLPDREKENYRSEMCTQNRSKEGWTGLQGKQVSFLAVSFSSLLKLCSVTYCRNFIGHLRHERQATHKGACGDKGPR